ncbi:hypothetical protein ACFPJ1_13015 [Kribbella qitaiheensis]|uniref:AMIN-like domain-containing (lipo)protein n=1 Tax=Kribbella qitaiheensis TaxID=1544730 RepID=UPI003611285A
MKHFHTIRNPLHRPIRTAFAVLAIAAVPAAAIAVPALAGQTTTSKSTATMAAATTKCPTGWGSLLEANNKMSAAKLTNVRTGRHACFDRIVFDLAGKPTGYHVSYVKNVYTDGQGALVPLRGGAKLQLVVRGADYNDAGVPTYKPANRRELTNVTGYQTFRQVAYAGSFEGQTTIGLGVRARLPFRVLTLTGPGNTSRVVVDVAHRW